MKHLHDTALSKPTGQYIHLLCLYRTSLFVILHRKKPPKVPKSMAYHLTESIADARYFLFTSQRKLQNKHLKVRFKKNQKVFYCE